MTDVTITDESLVGVKDKIVLITGGSSGIGRATVQLCLDLGATVVNGDRNPPEPAFEPSEKLKFVEVDVTNWESLRNMFIKANEWFGRIDHVFANAGVGPSTDFLDVTLNDEGLLEPPTLHTFDVNLLGSIYTVRLAAAYMSELATHRPAGMGSIVLMASASSFQSFSQPDYIVTKHGVLGLLRGLQKRLAGKIRVNAVAPLWTATKMVPADLIESRGGKLQSPNDVARSAVLLFADDRRHGEVIYSWEGNFREINKSEGGLLNFVHTLLPRGAYIRNM